MSIDPNATAPLAQIVDHHVQTYSSWASLLKSVNQGDVASAIRIREYERAVHVWELLGLLWSEPGALDFSV
jgi:hypothetical protein